MNRTHAVTYFTSIENSPAPRNAPITEPRKLRNEYGVTPILSTRSPQRAFENSFARMEN